MVIPVSQERYIRVAQKKQRAVEKEAASRKQRPKNRVNKAYKLLVARAVGVVEKDAELTSHDVMI